MSTPRITQRLMVERSLGSLQTGLGRLARSQEQLSTGRVINRPSDSPTGTNDAMRLRAQIASDTQHARNASDGLSYLGRTDEALSRMVDGLRRARDLVVQGASTGSAGPQAREALATELEQIRASMLSLANTQHMGRALFGGTSGSPQAYAADGTFIGDRNDVVRMVGDDTSVKVNTTGPAAFETPGGQNLFGILDATIAAMRTTPEDLGTSLEQIDAVQSTMLSALADVGTRYGRVEDALSTLGTTEITNKTALSEVENVDIAKAIVDLQMQEVAYQSALGATARVLQPSLLDFLR
jgi:flagellar hook-associated protein 3 FlgL